MFDFKSLDPPDDDTINNALRDFGLYHDADTAIRMYVEYRNNKRYWYPGAGVDQPDEYWHDISMLNWLDLYVEHVLPKARMMAQFERDDVIDRLKRGGSLNA